MPTSDSHPPATSGSRAFCFRGWEFVPSAGVLRQNGKEELLPPRVAALLERLLDSPGEVVPKEELIEHVWPDTAVSDNSLSEAVRVLRRVLNDDPRQPAYVQTLPRRGYRFVAEVTEAEVSMNGATPADVAPSPAEPSRAVPGPRAEDDAHPGYRLPPISRQTAVALVSIAALLVVTAIWLQRRLESDGQQGLRAVMLSSTTAGDPALGGAPPELSPHGQWVAFTTDDLGIRIYNVETGEQRDIHAPGPGNPGRVRNGQLVWSPDGRQLAFLWRDLSTRPDGWQVRVVDVETREWTIALTTNEHALGLHDWGASGRLLLGVRDLDTEGRFLEPPQRYVELPVEDVPLSALPPPLLELDGIDRGARYSPDASRFAYAVSAPGQPTATIYVGSRDRAEPHSPVSPPGAQDRNPVWSPDGRYLAFERQGRVSTDIMAVEVTAAGVGEAVTLHTGDNGLRLVGWTPATGIVFRERFIQRSLASIAVDPAAMDTLGSPDVLSELVGVYLAADFWPSRGGDRFIVLDSRRNGQPLLLTAEGARPIPLPTDYSSSQILGWGPDDDWIIGVGGRADDGPRFLFRLDPVSGAVQREVSLPAEPLHFAGSHLSPDGRWVTAQRGEVTPADELELVAIDTDSGEIHGLGIRAVGFQTSWAPDSTRLAAVITPGDGPWSLQLIGRDGDATTLAEFPDACCDRPTFSADGRWIALRVDEPTSAMDFYRADGFERPVRLTVDDVGGQSLGPLKWSTDGRAIFTMLHQPVDGLTAMQNAIVHLERARARAGMSARK